MQMLERPRLDNHQGTISQIADGNIRAGLNEVINPIARYEENLAGLPLSQRAETLKEYELKEYASVLKETFPVLDQPEHLETLQLAVLLTDLRVRNGYREMEGTIGENRRNLQYAGQLKEAHYAEIRKGMEGKSSIPKKIQSASALWTPVLEYLENRVQVQETLRDTALAVFAKEYIMTPKGIEKLHRASEKLFNTTDFTQADLSVMMNASADYFRNARRMEDADYFAYKDQGWNLSTLENSQTMRNVAILGLEPQNPEGINRGIGDVAKAMLEFYWNHAASIFGQEEKTPHLAFAYDFLFSLVVTDNRDRFLAGLSWFVDHAAKEEKPILQEFRTSEVLSLSDEEKAAAVIRKLLGIDSDKIDLLFKRAMNGDRGFMDQYRQATGDKYLIGKYSDRTAALETALRAAANLPGGVDFLAKYAKHRIKTKGINALKQEIEREGDIRQFGTAFRKVLYSYLPSGVADLDVLATRWMSKQDYISGVAGQLALDQPTLSAFSFEANAQMNYRYYLNTLGDREIDKISDPYRTDLLNSIILKMMFVENSPNKWEETQELARQNNHKWQQLTEWEPAKSIPEEGLRFAYPDPDMETYHLEEIWLRKSPEDLPGEVRVEFRPEGSDKTATLVVDSNGNLKSIFGRELARYSPVWLEQSAKDLIYRKLALVNRETVVFKGI